MLCGILFNVLFKFSSLYLMWYCIIEPHEVQDSQINIIIAIKHSKYISIAIKYSKVVFYRMEAPTVPLPGGRGLHAIKHKFTIFNCNTYIFVMFDCNDYIYL